MSTAELKRLKAAAWQIGGAGDFLQLSGEEAMLVEPKLMLTDAIKASRQKRGLSQIDIARSMRSSQSGVAKIEAGDPSVSLDLIMRAFFATGAARRELQRAFGVNEKLAA
jgi:Helix-turn-helix